MSKSLIMDDAKKDINSHSLSVYARIELFSAIIIEASFFEQLAKIFSRGIFFVKFERRRVMNESVGSGRFARKHLDYHSNGHPTGKSMGVEQNVRNHSGVCKRQILSRPLLRANSLLSSSGGKFVTDAGVARNPVGDTGSVCSISKITTQFHWVHVCLFFSIVFA